MAKPVNLHGLTWAQIAASYTWVDLSTRRWVEMTTAHGSWSRRRR